MKKRPVNRQLASSSRPARCAGPVPLSARDSENAPRLRRQQLAADQVEIRQREETEGARQVLGEAAIARQPAEPRFLGLAGALLQRPVRLGSGHDSPGCETACLAP